MTKTKKHANRARKPTDDRATPYEAWRDLFKAYPSLKRRILYDPFYYDGATGRHWKRLGVSNFVHKDKDFYTHKAKYDVICTNPPFSSIQQVLKAVMATGKPWVMLLNVQTVFTQYFRNTVGPNFKLIIPPGRVYNDRRFRLACVWVCVGCGTRKTLTVM
jgi:hypothetical protein